MIEKKATGSPLKEEGNRGMRIAEWGFQTRSRSFGNSEQDRTVIGSLLETNRLLLKPLGPEDAQYLLQYAMENKSWLEPWEPSHPASYFSLEGQKHILNQCLEDRRLESGVLFGIFEREGEPERLLGRISISGIMRGIWQNGFVGYSIAGDRGGQGYMTEALNRVVRFGFNDLGLHRLQASIIPRNKPSLRVAEKCNFRMEGRALRYLRINEVWEDHDIFALTVDEMPLMSSNPLVERHPPQTTST